MTTPKPKKLRRELGFEFKFAGGDGTFSGYGAVYGNVDAGGDLILKGAFRDSLKAWNAKGKLPKMLLQHAGWGANDALPIGVWTEMKEDGTGLYVEGQLIALDTDRGKTIYAGLKSGALDALSIGYRAIDYSLGTKPSDPYRTIKKAELYEVSVVLFGMNDQALIDSVKSEGIDAIDTLSDAEDFLREAGGPLSKKAARDLVSRIARIARREADAGSKSLDDLLRDVRSVRQLTTTP